MDTEKTIYADRLGPAITAAADPCLETGTAINGTEQERRCFEPLLPTLIQSLAKARCLVSIDTGTMHLSTALGTPTVGLFGPTIPELTGPYSKQTLSEYSKAVFPVSRVTGQSKKSNAVLTAACRN